jgi:UPF0755 protein
MSVLGKFILLALIGVCVVAVFAASFFAPRALAQLGDPSPHLDPFQETFLGAYLLINKTALDLPAGDSQDLVEIEVEPGADAATIAANLERLNVIRDSWLLRSYLRYRGLDTAIEAGTYQLSGTMTVTQIAESLQSAPPEDLYITVLEGWRAEQIANTLDRSEYQVTGGEFLEVLRTRPGGYSFAGELPEPLWLEGFLFPDTYLIDPQANASEIVMMMLDNFELKVGIDLKAGFSQNNLSIYEAVTLASIIQREAIVIDELPLIASVFINRLNLGMKLDADPTVQYAVGEQADGSWWKVPLTLDDLAFNSPYNTYVYEGLPPGPIANPGLEALRAVAFPEESNYFYFRARCDGSERHAFAVTFEEHLQNGCD